MKPKTPDLHLLLASSCYLMTRYSLHCSDETAKSIVHHIKMLLAHPDIQASRSAKTAYNGLLFDWEHIVACHTCSSIQTENKVLSH